MESWGLLETIKIQTETLQTIFHGMWPQCIINNYISYLNFHGTQETLSNVWVKALEVLTIYWHHSYLFHYLLASFISDSLFIGIIHIWFTIYWHHSYVFHYLLTSFISDSLLIDIIHIWFTVYSNHSYLIHYLLASFISDSLFIGIIHIWFTIYWHHSYVFTIYWHHSYLIHYLMASFICLLLFIGIIHISFTICVVSIEVINLKLYCLQFWLHLAIV